MSEKRIRYSIVLFCALLSLDCYGQYESVSDFYRQMFEIKLFREFTKKHAAHLKDYRTRHDTTRIDTTYTLHFDKHPNLNKSSGGGRLEMFSSTFADSTSVYEVSQCIYICFKTQSEGELFLDNLRSQLRKISWKEVVTKTDAYDQFTVLGKELLDSNGKPKSFVSTEYPCGIVLRLIPNKQTGGCELFIGI